MESIEHATNTGVLSHLAGKPVAKALLARYGGPTSLAQASFDALQTVPETDPWGLGEHKEDAQI
jgi:hypothetical protein